MSSYKLTKEDGSELTAKEAYEAALKGPCYNIISASGPMAATLSETGKARISTREASSRFDEYYCIELTMTEFFKDGDDILSVLFVMVNDYSDGSLCFYAGEDPDSFAGPPPS